MQWVTNGHRSLGNHDIVGAVEFLVPVAFRRYEELKHNQYKYKPKKAVLMVTNTNRGWAITNGVTGLMIKLFESEEEAHIAMADPVKVKFWEYWGIDGLPDRLPR